MDKIIKLPSVQGFSFSKGGADNTASKSLLDFVIPEGDVYNLADSYININVGVDAPDGDNTGGAGTGVALIQFGVLTDVNTGTTNNRQVPNVSLVKNCFMESQNGGMIESIRRVNTLRCLLESVETDFDERNSKDYINAVTFKDQENLVYSPVREVVKVATTQAGVSDDTQTTIARNHDIRIPLKDIFNFCRVTQYDSNKYGNTKIHLEMDLKRLTAFQILGENDGTWNDANGNQNKFEDTAVAGAGGLVVQSIKTQKADYKGYQECPYYIGQKLFINATGGGGAASLVRYPATVTAVELDVDSRLEVTFNRNLSNLTNGQSLTDITVFGVDVASITINVNHAELVLKSVVNPQNVPATINYTSYSVEEDNGNNLTNFTRQYIVEPECSNLVVAMPNTNDGLVSNKGFTHYRIRVNNVDQTQRDIVRSSPLHLDRIMRYCDNRNIRFKNTSQLIRNIKHAPNEQEDQTRGIGNHLQIREDGILEPLPITQESKLVGLEIVTGGLGDIILYKQVLKQL